MNTRLKSRGIGVAFILLNKKDLILDSRHLIF